MNNIIKFIVKNLQKKSRIDYYLSQIYKDLSRNKIKNLIQKNFLKINGTIITDPSKKIVNGDEVFLEVKEDKEVSLKPFNYELNIIFEDKDLIIINKKAGISIHPGAGNYDKTIVNALIKYKGKNLSDISDKFRPGIVHRIDKDTSGLIVIAKNNFTHINLSKQFKDHSIERKYLAMVWGKIRPQFGRIETLIKRSSKNRQLMEVGISKGKKAITNYKTLEVFESGKIPTFSLVECTLETGRTHQIRVHLKHKGNAILGDRHYKKKYKEIKNVEIDTAEVLNSLNRQFLHAKSIGFVHPRENKKIFFEVDLPSELKIIIKKLRNT